MTHDASRTTCISWFQLWIVYKINSAIDGFTSGWSRQFFFQGEPIILEEYIAALTHTHSNLNILIFLHFKCFFLLKCMFYNSVASFQKLQIIILILKKQIFIPINVNTLASITATKNTPKVLMAR